MTGLTSHFIIRKIIHILSGLIFIYLAGYDGLMKILLGAGVAFSLFLDFLRWFWPAWNSLFLKIFGPYVKPSERDKSITGASILWLGLYLLYLIFPFRIFHLAALITLLADPAAAIFGKIFPLISFSNFRSLGGSGLFFLTAGSILWQYGNIPLIPSGMISIILTAVELWAPEKFENLILSICSGALICLFGFL